MSYQRSERHLENIRNASRLSIEGNVARKNERIEKYNADPKKCVFCTVPISYSRKMNKFCSKKCSASYNNQSRKHTDESKAKIKNTLINKFSKEKPSVETIGNTNFYRKCCQNCKIEFFVKRKNTVCCSRTCSASLIAKNMTEEQREKMSNLGRQNIIKQAQSGKWKGWSGRSEPSFPEKYISGLLGSHGFQEHVHYRRELPTGGFFIDFAFEKQKIAFEVDGKQHEYPENKERDQRKNNFLLSEGWSVYRLKWHSVKKESGKKKVHQQFELIVSQIRNIFTEN